MKKYLTLALALMLCFVFVTACDNAAPAATGGEPVASAPEAPAEQPIPDPAEPPEPTGPIPDEIPGTILMSDGGVIRFELYPHIAPQSVFNFIYLARQGFYDGLSFHRIINGFMAQGGCPEGTGMGNPGYAIKGEFSSNGFENDLLHTRGVLSMARASHYDSAGSQFFIMFGTQRSLDGLYAAFGSVTDGMDVVDQLEATPNDGPNGYVAQANRPVIESITIDSDVVVPWPDKLPRP
jgi:peptidyl-prolyl cis-trans isomerase B (cyclophilin B)